MITLLAASAIGPATLDATPPACTAFLPTKPASTGSPAEIAPTVGMPSAAKNNFCFNKFVLFSSGEMSSPLVIGLS